MLDPILIWGGTRPLLRNTHHTVTTLLTTTYFFATATISHYLRTFIRFDNRYGTAK